MHSIFFNPPIEQFALGHQFSEIYKDRIYERFLPVDKSNTVCLDVGANIGITAYYFSQYFEKVVSLEPAQEHFALLSNMLSFNNIDNVTAINKALFFKEGEFNFYHPTNKTSYSLHTAVSQGPQVSPPEKVTTITLEKLFEEQKIDHVDLMKLDVEGSEFEILGSTDFKNVSDKIKTILVERHSWSGRNPSQLEDTLRMRGYKIEKLPHDADLLIATK